MYKALLVCTIKPPPQTKMVIQPSRCRLIKVNDKMYESLLLEPALDLFQSDPTMEKRYNTLKEPTLK